MFRSSADSFGATGQGTRLPAATRSAAVLVGDVAAGLADVRVTSASGRPCQKPRALITSFALEEARALAGTWPIGFADGAEASCTGRDVADARPKPVGVLVSGLLDSDLAVSSLAAGFATGSGTAAGFSAFGATAATFLVVVATTSSSSSSEFPNSLENGFVIFGAAVATRVPRSFEATVVSGPLARTLASCASGIRGQ